jgi:hypothetical protein
MDEYIKIIDQVDPIFLGFHNGLYNARLEQLSSLVHYGQVEQVPGSHLPEDYLQPGKWIYRFPFPDEDHIGIGKFSPFDRGVNISISSTPKLHDMLVNGELKHTRITQGIGESNGSNIPCPYDPEIRKDRRYHTGIREPSIELVGTILMEEGRNIWSVCRCTCCHSIYIMNHFVGQYLHDAAIHNTPSQFYWKIAMRIYRGYLARGNFLYYGMWY